MTNRLSTSVIKYIVFQISPGTDRSDMIVGTWELGGKRVKIGLVYFPENFAKFFTFPVTSNL